MLLDRCLSVLSCLSCLQRGQMVGWIKMKLDVQVGLGLGHIVLHGDPAPLPHKPGRGPAVEHWSLANVLSLSCARLVADG